MKIEESIGARIHAERERQRLSLSELGERLAQYLGKPWTPQAVWQAEKGRRDFKAAQLIAFSLALRVPVTELVAPNEDDLALTDAYALTRDDALALFPPGATPGVGPVLADLMDRLDEAAEELREARERVNRAEQISTYGADLLGGLLAESRRPATTTKKRGR